jgi:hypothetical protein
MVKKPTLLFLLLTIFVLTILSSCNKRTTREVYEYRKEYTSEVKKDSLYTHKPDSVKLEKEIDLNIQPCQNIIEVNTPCNQTANSKKLIQPINTDTLWVKGRFADSYSFIRNNKLVHGMIEGKEFEILLKDITTERDHYKELYRVETQSTVNPSKSSWKTDALIVLFVAIILSLLALLLRQNLKL